MFSEVEPTRPTARKDLDLPREGLILEFKYELPLFGGNLTFAYLGLL